ncbi:MAG: Rrf2 family transcriptional regulator [Kiritimatiellae bacterium]|nr:Rrf2 family transcriptional regulator [Kiritimatiellia bacterium]
MKLSAQTRTAMRILLQVGSSQDLVSTRTIADAQGMSQKFITTVIVPLKRAGFIDVKRGVKGGIALAKAPSGISIVDVMETFQGPIRLLECLSESQACPQKPKCPLHAGCRKINAALKETLGRFTLADGLKELAELRRQNPDDPDSCLRKGVFIERLLSGENAGRTWRGC